MHSQVWGGGTGLRHVFFGGRGAPFDSLLNLQGDISQTHNSSLKLPLKSQSPASLLKHLKFYTSNKKTPDALPQTCPHLLFLITVNGMVWPVPLVKTLGDILASFSASEQTVSNHGQLCFQNAP